MFKENFNKILCYENVFKLRCILLRLYFNVDLIILFLFGCEMFYVFLI